MGQYEYHEEKGYYIQTSTEENNEDYQTWYLYQFEDEEWIVSHIPGARSGWLTNANTSKTVPTSGWKYYDGESWQHDPTLVVTPAPLPRQFSVTAQGSTAEDYPSYLGVFTRTERWWVGRPVYVNSKGRLLYYGRYWAIGDTIGYCSLCGSQAHHSPAHETSWTFWTGSEDKPVSVVVKGLH